ncbi:glycosyltransferase [Leucobacter chromiireducens]|uniref:glycosyltransferase n=1 Tax=Leucobacter chromiireducens TaxID=283877 RepID=UPI000F638BD6|nr:glycosyltransferase [Leucobacter chromiireducens]
MRIALVSMHTSPAAVPGRGDAGGMNVVVAQAARALARAGHEVVVFTRASAAQPAGEVALGDGAILRALAAGDPAAGKAELPGIVPEFAAALAGHGPFDAVHAHYWLSGIAALPLAARSGLTPALTLHTVAAQKNGRLAPGDAPEPALRLAGERALARRTQLIACSASERAAIVEGYGAPALPIPVVMPGVDTELFAPRAAADAPPLRITVLGRVQPLKGQDLAVAAAAALARVDPALWARCELVVAGEPTPGAEGYAAQLRAAAARAGIADRVRFLPAQDRAAAASLLAGSALVLVPSHSETFGLVALEAAAAGVPAVVAAHTGLLEASPPGAAGARVAGRDPEEWASAIGELLRDPARRAQLGREARAHALTHNWDAHAAQLTAAYSALRAPQAA